MLNPRAAFRIALPLLLAAAVIACDSTTEPEPNIRIVGLTLEAVGDVAQMEVRMDGEAATARWESLDPEIVTVTTGGLARAVSHGIATVKAEIDGRSAEGEVTVLPPVNVQVSELAVVTDAGGSQGTEMRLQNHGGRGYFRLEFWKLRPDGSHERIMYHTNDAEAPVGLNITYSHFSSGETPDWVMAFSREPLALEGTRTSCVRMDGADGCPSDDPPQQQPAVDSVVVTPGAAVMAIGQTTQYTARAYADGQEVMGRPVQWSTNTPSIISLSETGLARALAAGYGQVEATVDGVSSAVGLTVMTPEPAPEPVGYIWIDTHNLPVRLWLTQGWSLVARVMNSQGLPIEGHTVTWAVQNPAVATVDSVGHLTGVGPGATMVIATAGGKTAYAPVQVFARPADRAEFVFAGLLSDSSVWMVQPSTETTWTDPQGVEHPAFITFNGGHLSLEWDAATTPHYEQRLTMRTYIYQDSLQLVDETEYVDTGSLTVYYDVYTGNHIFQMTSAVVPGLAYQGTYSLPGELSVAQTVGDIPNRRYYFEQQ